MSTRPTSLRVLVLPAADGDLVLPVSAVAELARAESLTPPPADGQPWLIGALQWRGCEVPVVRLAHPPTGGRRHVAVCFAPSGGQNPQFIAIESPGLPRLERLTPELVSPEPEARPTTPFYLSPLRLLDRPAWLLDLDALERALTV